MQLIRIDLNSKDAELFKLFRKYQDEFTAILKTGLFELEEGQILINKTGGHIHGIDAMKIPLYRYKKKR